MQYTWYEIVAMSVLVGAIAFIVFRGFDLALERLLEALAARRDRKLAAEEHAAAMAKTFPKQDKGDRG